MNEPMNEPMNESMNGPNFTPKPTPMPPLAKKKKKRANIPAIILLVISLVLLSICILLAIRCTNLTKQTSSSAITTIEEEGETIILDDFKNRLSAGDSVLSVLKDYYPDHIVYVDNGHYVFAEILSTLAKNNLTNGTFNVDNNGEITYSENGSVISHKGIDLSQFNGTVDFSRVKNSGVEYAMLRCGYRGYGSGALMDDATFSDNIQGALQNNLKVGVYFFTQAINKQEAIEEADYVIEQIKTYNVTGPIAIDVEAIVGDDYRQQSLTTAQLTDVVIAFCDRVKEKGYTPMIYGNLTYLIGRLDLTRLEAYEKWFAYYSTELYYPYALSMWQYSDSGSVDGVDGSVDLNINFKTW